MDNASGNTPNPNRSDSIPLGGAPSQPARPEAAGGTGTPNVSRAPLNLGATTNPPAASGAPAAPSTPAAAKVPATPGAAKPPLARPVPPKPATPVAAGERITACKTFFTKLHPGAILFLEGQVNDWLKNNPGIVIKRTDVTVGEILEKKSEPSLIIMVWY